jgi:hypothetical protein
MNIRFITMAHVKTYFLAPNFDFRPGGKIAIGNIIADPFAPHRVITTPSTPLTDEHVQEIVQHDYRTQRKAGGGVNLSIWAQLLHSINFKMSSAYSKDTTVEYKMDSLRTIQYRIDPTLEEIMTRIQETKVKNIMQPNRYRSSPVYMITAVKVAEKLSFSVGNNHCKSGELEGSIPISESVKTGASLSISRQNEQQESFHLEDDVVFAYQLLEIGFNGWRNKTVGFEEYRNQAAFLSDDRQKEEELRTDVEFRGVDAAHELDAHLKASLRMEMEITDRDGSYIVLTSAAHN